MKLRCTTPAEASYAAAFFYLFERNPSAALRFEQEVEQAFERVGRHPDLGHYIPEHPAAPYKEIIVWSHRFFCRVVNQTIWVVGVWHGARIAAEPRLPELGADG